MPEMSTKGRIKSSGVFLGEIQGISDQSFRQTVIEQQWHNYKVTNDLECLAQICEHADYFGNSDIGRVLASELRRKRRRVKGYEAELDWEWALRQYNELSNDPTWKAPKTAEARRLRVAELLNIPDLDREKWTERFRKQLKARGQTD
jgi:hypothetical protein